VANRVSPGTVLTIGLCLASIAFMLWAVQATALDPGALHADAREVLSESPVRHAMTTRVAGAIVTGVPADVADPDLVAVVAARAIEQPQFVAAFADALDQVQEHVAAGAVGPIVLDPARVTEAVRAAGATVPQLALPLATTPQLVVAVPDDQIPSLAQWTDVWKMTVRVLAFGALLLVTYAVLCVEHRIWAVRRIGRWAIVVGLATLGLFWVLPRVLLRPLGGWIAVGGAVAASGDVLVPISIALVAGGALAVVGAHRWDAHDRRRVLSVIPRAQTRSATAGHGRWESPV
jgi:hypothetical protein